MIRPLSAVVLQVLVLGLLAAPLAAQTGTIRGHVLAEGGRPLAGAQVEVIGTRLGALAAADGAFEVRGVPPGVQRLRAHHIGYRAAEQEVRLSGGPAASVEFTLLADPLGLQEVVVSGSFNPASKLESSTAITTLTPAQVEYRAPRGTADLLKAVPGLQVMSNSGETGADVTVRGLPQTANSSFRYISVQEDGLPVFEAPGLVFAFPDAMARLDATVARVETVRGGSASVFASSTPGGIVNLISHTGGAQLGGTVRTTLGSQEMVRTDLNLGGPLGERWRFNVGGYFRYDEGVRSPGFPANEGGQVRANLTRELGNGYVRLYGKYLDERNVWYLGIPIRNFARPEAIPGGPRIGSGTTFSPERRTLSVPDAFNPGSMVERQLDGNTTRYRMGALDFARRLGGWDLLVRGKVLSADNLTNLMADVADPMPISSFGAPQLPAEVPRLIRFVHDGEIIGDPSAAATLNSNGLMSVHGLAFIDQPVRNAIGNLRLSRQFGPHRLNTGLYLSDYSSSLRLVQQGVFLEVRNQPRLVQVGIPGPEGFVGLTPGNGFAAFNTGLWNLRSNTSVAAAYVGDEWAATERLTLDLGARVDHSWSDGRNERPVNPGRVVDGVVVGQQVPAGFSPFVPTPEQSQAGLFGSGIYRTWDYTFTTWSASLGANYRLSDELAFYGRASRGNRIPTSQQWTFQTSDGSQVTGETNRGEIEETLQAELGVKAAAARWSLLLTGFYGSSKNLITVLQRGQPDGSFAFLPISGDTRTFGAELEGVVSPLPGLQLTSVTTLQDPRFTRFAYEFFVPGNGPYSGAQVRDYSGNQLNDAVRVLTDFTASYARGGAEVFGNYRYTGERMANRPNTVTIPGFSEVGGGVAYGFRQMRVTLQGVNLTNTQAIVQMAARTGEDILQVNPDGTAVTLVTTGPAAGTTTTSIHTTGLGILPRSLQLSVSYGF